MLMASAQEIFDKLISPDTLKHLPVQLRCIAALLWEGAHKYGREAQCVLVNSFLMLRFLSPAIVAPEAFNILPANYSSSPPVPKVRRNVILIAKLLQTLSNNVELGEKEDYMKCTNDFILRNQTAMREFLTSLPLTRDELDKSGVLQPYSVSKATLQSELAKVHRKEFESLYKLMNESLMRYAKDNPRKITSEDAQFLQALSEIASSLCGSTAPRSSLPQGGDKENIIQTLHAGRVLVARYGTEQSKRKFLKFLDTLLVTLEKSRKKTDKNFNDSDIQSLQKMIKLTRQELEENLNTEVAGQVSALDFLREEPFMPLSKSASAPAVIKDHDSKKASNAIAELLKTPVKYSRPKPTAGKLYTHKSDESLPVKESSAGSATSTTTIGSLPIPAHSSSAKPESESEDDLVDFLSFLKLQNQLGPKKPSVDMKLRKKRRKKEPKIVKAAIPVISSCEETSDLWNTLRDPTPLMTKAYYGLLEDDSTLSRSSEDDSYADDFSISKESGSLISCPSSSSINSQVSEKRFENGSTSSGEDDDLQFMEFLRSDHVSLFDDMPLSPQEIPEIKNKVVISTIRVDKQHKAKDKKGFLDGLLSKKKDKKKPEVCHLHVNPIYNKAGISQLRSPRSLSRSNSSSNGNNNTGTSSPTSPGPSSPSSSPMSSPEITPEKEHPNVKKNSLTNTKNSIFDLQFLTKDLLSPSGSPQTSSYHSSSNKLSSPSSSSSEDLPTEKSKRKPLYHSISSVNMTKGLHHEDKGELSEILRTVGAESSGSEVDESSPQIATKSSSTRLVTQPGGWQGLNSSLADFLGTLRFKEGEGTTANEVKTEIKEFLSVALPASRLVPTHSSPNFTTSPKLPRSSLSITHVAAIANSPPHDERDRVLRNCYSSSEESPDTELL
eukprot:TRINITY_DN3205_c0_g2_i1.p1 TRINITY_DN3205_c0_g2~~TRINITY_DN3205_c0_g2_i1.p1  ORF type:complete len:1002 (-),score=219.77 TRINITY_DN3205_c0_g2_i1:96-2774(-)